MLSRRSFLGAIAGALVGSRLPATRGISMPSGAAISIPFGKLPTATYIEGPRYLVTVSRMAKGRAALGPLRAWKTQSHDRTRRPLSPLPKRTLAAAVPRVDGLG